MYLYLSNDAKVLFQQPKNSWWEVQFLLELMRVTNAIAAEMLDLFVVVITCYPPENSI